MIYISNTTNSFIISNIVKATAANIIAQVIYVRIFIHFCWVVLMYLNIRNAVHAIMERKNIQIQIAANFSFKVSTYIKNLAVSISHGSMGIGGTTRCNKILRASVTKLQIYRTKPETVILLISLLRRFLLSKKDVSSISNILNLGLLTTIYLPF